MIVHLIGSLREPEVDAAYLRQIIESIHDHGAVIAHNWLEPSLTRQKADIAIQDWSPFVDANLDAIKRADIVIADLTHYSFAQGFMVAAALKDKKPILAVSRNPVDSHTASGITNTLFTYKQYTDNASLGRLVSAFLDQNTVHTKDLRFNMFLTRQTFKYLEETSQETGKSRSEIIRALVKKKAEEERRG
jgi:hypothetical protein